MLKTKTWNAETDCYEYVITLPIDCNDIDRYKIDENAINWLRKTKEFVENNCPILRQISFLKDLIEKRIQESKISLIVISEKDMELKSKSNENIQVFICFGEHNLIGEKSSPLYFKLNQDKPDWSFYEKTLGFNIPKYIKLFYESFPSLHIGMIDFSPFLLDLKCWLDYKYFYGYNEKNEIVTPESIVDKMKDYIIFRTDYWGNKFMLHKNGSLWKWDINDNLHILEMSIESWFESSLKSEIEI